MTIEQQTAAEVLEAMRQREREYRERDAPGAIPQTPEQIEATAKYWETVFSTPPKSQTGYVMVRNTNQEMDYLEARKKVWALLQMRACHIEAFENFEVRTGKPFEWQFDENDIFIIQNTIKFFINDCTCKFPLTKGLFFYGAPGTGKTEIVNVMAKFCADNELTKKFEISSLSEIYVKYKADKAYNPVTPFVQFDRAFDELGRYAGPVVSFGDPLDINEAIIEQRYERMKRYGQLTHFIANATPNELEPLFTPMVFDRLRSMCTGVHFKGNSKRYYPDDRQTARDTPQSETVWPFR